MSFMQILDCNSTVGDCCGDYGLVKILSMIRRALSLVQLIAPILLLAFVIIGLLQLVVNPDEKNGTKKILNKFLAAVMCFLLPSIVDIFFAIMPDSVQVGACWKSAEAGNNLVSTGGTSSGDDVKDEKNNFFAPPNSYEGLGGK